MTQDLIACAGQVFYTNDLGVEVQADAVDLLPDILAEGGELDVAYRTAASLSSDLSVVRRENL